MIPRPRFALPALLALTLALGTFTPAAPLARAQEDEAELAPATREARDLQAKADEQLKAKKNAEAIATYKQLLDHLERKKGELTDFPEYDQKAVRVHALYNTACALALLGKKTEALETLSKAVEQGFYDWQLLEKDEDLSPLREEPRWKEIVARLHGEDKEVQRLEKLAREAVSDSPLFDFDFEVTTLDGSALKLSDLRGKTVIVDCWGTWCPPCREEVPSLVRLLDEATKAGRPLAIVGLAYERADPTDKIAKAVKDFVAEQKVNYPVALMKEKDPILDRIPELSAFPTTLWIDARGKVRARQEGLRSFEELDAITRRLLAESAPAKTGATPGEKPPEKRPASEPF